MIENTSQLIEEISGITDILGALLVGSAAESYRDDLSDLDVEIIVNNRFLELPESLRSPGRISRRLDLSCVDMDSFLLKRDSPKDVDHWPYQGCRILYDPGGVLVNEVAAIVEIHPDVRLKRVWLHFFEFIYYSRRFNKFEFRPSALNRSLAAAKAVESLVKTIFVAHRRWPPLSHWSEQQLRALDIPASLIENIVRLLESPSRSAAQALEASLRSELLRLGDDLLPDDEILVRTVTSPSFRSTRERYSSF